MPDVATAISGPSVAPNGGPVSYTVVTSSNGPAPATGVVQSGAANGLPRHRHQRRAGRRFQRPARRREPRPHHPVLSWPLAGGQLQPLDLSNQASGAYLLVVTGQQPDGSPLCQVLRLTKE